MAKVVEKFGLNNGEPSCSPSIEVSAVAIAAWRNFGQRFYLTHGVQHGVLAYME